MWDQWNAAGGPRYPHEKVIQFCFRNYSLEMRTDVHVLDLGCGNGVNTIFLAREGFRVTGIDISPSGIDKAQKNLAAEGLKADLYIKGIDDLEFFIFTLPG